MSERVYCLALVDNWGTFLSPDGTTQRCYLLLNRRYKPAFTGITEWVSYPDCPGTRVWLDEKFLRAIDGGSTPYARGDSRCWLYYDATRTRHADYRRRLAMLMRQIGETSYFPSAGLYHGSTAEAR